MPIAQITIMEGRDDAKKERLITEVTEAIHRALGAPRENIRVIIYEVKKTEFGIGGQSARQLGR